VKKPVLISERTLFRGRVVTAGTERLRFANGTEHELDMIRHPGAAAMVAVDDARRVCLVRQYRRGVDDFMWEIPAGKLDAGEAPELTAVRELTEEAGASARNWRSLGRYYPAAGIMDEVVHLFLATDLTLGRASPDADEELEIAWLPLELAVKRALEGEYDDGKTIAGLLRAQHSLATA
jgi:8-oxo-dGTP pyrophosphatase MutT (NUDIX family)